MRESVIKNYMCVAYYPIRVYYYYISCILATVFVIIGISDHKNLLFITVIFTYQILGMIVSHSDSFSFSRVFYNVEWRICHLFFTRCFCLISNAIIGYLWENIPKTILFLFVWYHSYGLDKCKVLRTDMISLDGISRDAVTILFFVLVPLFYQMVWL
jgi:hypothetical protein